MSPKVNTDAMALHKHIAGAGLLLCALATLALVPMLPARGAANIELPFLQDVQQPVVVAFAGYPGCGTICPTSLSLLSGVYRQIESSDSQLGMLFINIQRDSSHETTAAYARDFHPEFLSYTVSSADADSVYRSLALQSFDDAGAAIAHSGLIYVFSKGQEGWRIEHVYRRPPSPDRLKVDLQNLTAAAQPDTGTET